MVRQSYRYCASSARDITFSILPGSILPGRAWGENEQMEAALLAGRFELGSKLGTAIDLHRSNGKRHAVLQGVEELSCGLSGGAGVRFGSRPSGKPHRGR